MDAGISEGSWVWLPDVVDVPEVYLVKGSMRSLADLHRVGFLTCRALALQTRTGGIGAAAREEPHLVDSEVLFTLKLLESQFHNDVAPLMVSELIISENQ